MAECSVGNLTNIDYPVSPDVSFAYDSLNRLTNMIDGVGTNIFTYTGGSQLFTEDGPFASDTITNFYCNRMRTNLTLVQPSGLWTNAFTYDSANRLYSVGSRAGTYTYSYQQPSTRLTGITLPGGAYTHIEYDSMSRLTSTFLYNSSSTPLDGYLYQYDRENQRTNEVRTDSSTVAYTYDNVGQLKIADSSIPAEDRGYTYDTAWNLNYRTNNGSLSTFLADNKNQLTNAFGNTDTYDSSGNLTGVGWGKVYVYDDENQLAQWFSYQFGSTAPTNGDLRTDFVYDGLGRLRERIEYVLSCPQQATNPPPEGPALQQLDSGGGNNCTWNLTNEVHYVYDGMRVIQERNGSNTPLYAYTRGNDLSVSLEGAGGIGGLLARTKYVSGNPTSFALYFSDANGNVTSLIDTNQNVLASYRYDPFGNIISKSGTLADVNVYRFSSKEVHLNSGMYYYGYRFYDPNSQRWVNRDPIEEKGGINLHAFVENSPVFFVDPYGLILKIDPNAGPSFRDHMKDCIQNLINNSETGRKLVQEAIDSKYTITISTDDDAPRTDGSVVFPAEENRMPNIYMHPKSRTGWNPRLYRYGKRRYPDQIPPDNLDGCSVTLAHELGHALYDYEEPDNIPKIENPVRNDFHLSPRKNYRDKQVVP